MNLPNRLTILRIILVPAVVALILYQFVPAFGIIQQWLVAGIVFAAAAVTDAFDGKIARKRGIVTDFGKLLDPVADKLLVVGVLIAFLAVGLCSPWIILIVLLREFMVTSVRMVSASRGVVIPANGWGKAKTILQMIAISLIMAAEYFTYIIYHFKIPVPIWATVAAADAAQAVLWASAAVTIISGAVYLFESREIFHDT